MARLVYPTPEQWEVLKNFGLTGCVEDDDEVVLVAPSIARQLKTMGSTPDDIASGYHVGVGCDVSVDVVTTDDHQFFLEVEEAFEEAMTRQGFSLGSIREEE